MVWYDEETETWVMSHTESGRSTEHHTCDTSVPQPVDEEFVKAIKPMARVRDVGLFTMKTTSEHINWYEELLKQRQEEKEAEVRARSNSSYRVDPEYVVTTAPRRSYKNRQGSMPPIPEESVEIV
jgi:hypothetical protein